MLAANPLSLTKVSPRSVSPLPCPASGPAPGRQQTLTRLMNHLVTRTARPGRYPAHGGPAGHGGHGGHGGPAYGAMRRKNSWSCPSLAAELARLDERSRLASAWLARPAHSMSGMSAASSALSSASVRDYEAVRCRNVKLYG